MEIDIEALRQELLDFYGTAWASGNPMALAELSEIETASADELLDMAEELGLIEEDDENE